MGLPVESSLPPINWDNIKAKYPTVTPWSPPGLLSPDSLGSPAAPVHHPGYKKGTKSMAGQCGVPAVQGGSRIVGGYEAVPHSFPSMRVMLGAHNVREASEEGRIEVGTTDFFTHPGWSQFNLHNDLALVHLPYGLNFTEKIRPVCLPGHSEAGTAWDGEEAVASGWGKPTDSSTSISPTL